MDLLVKFKNGGTRTCELGPAYELVYVNAMGVFHKWSAYDIVKYLTEHPGTYNSNMFVWGCNGNIYCMDSKGSSFFNEPVEEYIIGDTTYKPDDFETEEERDEFWKMIFSIPL